MLYFGLLSFFSQFSAPFRPDFPFHLIWSIIKSQLVVSPEQHLIDLKLAYTSGVICLNLEGCILAPTRNNVRGVQKKGLGTYAPSTVAYNLLPSEPGPSWFDPGLVIFFYSFFQESHWLPYTLSSVTIAFCSEHGGGIWCKVGPNI